MEKIDIEKVMLLNKLKIEEKSEELEVVYERLKWEWANSEPTAKNINKTLTKLIKDTLEAYNNRGDEYYKNATGGLFCEVFLEEGKYPSIKYGMTIDDILYLD